MKGGNAPAGYDYNPNTAQLDQTVLYVERVPDTVQKDHIDWGFRASVIYGVDYRYTVSDGLLSNQLTKSNKNYGLDLPMEYAELYIPRVAKGLMIRVGRFISIPDIEAQLAPNNYMYSHSMTYTFDNFTNTGVLATLAVTKNLFLQAGVVGGTDTFIGNVGVNKPNPYPNPLFPNATLRKDPGAVPSFAGCIRYQSDSARDDLYVCINGINSGTWGYNNLQWKGFTYYHKFTDKFHVAVEVYNVHESNVPNVNNAEVANHPGERGHAVFRTQLPLQRAGRRPMPRRRDPIVQGQRSGRTGLLELPVFALSITCRSEPNISTTCRGNAPESPLAI